MSVVLSQRPARLGSKRPRAASHGRGHGPNLCGRTSMAKRTCTMAECGKLAHARGLCNKHYRRWLIHGDAATTLYHQFDRTLALTAVERVLSRIHVDERGCWVWQGCCVGGGYGQVAVGGVRLVTHRVVYEAVHGPIPDGLVLDHFVCDNPPCCNPDHVRPVTHRENILRGDGITAQLAAKRGCPHGHGEYDAVQGNGARVCRACQRESCRTYYIRRKQRAVTS